MEVEIIKWIIMTLGGIVVWFMKNTISDQQTEIKNLKSDIEVIKQEYLPKDDFKEFKRELRDMFTEIKTDIRELKNRHG